MNMALTVGADRDNSPSRRREICETMGLPFERLTVAEQVHGAEVAVVTLANAGSGRADSDARIAGADGLATAEQDVPLMVLGADCCLLTVVDPGRRAVGVAHAGWRGAAAGMAESLVRTMVEALGCCREAMLAALSPCAGACCYEVGGEVVSAMAGRGLDMGGDVLTRRDGRIFMNVAAASRLQLERSGVRSERIEVANVCTICRQGYYSYRRDNTTVTGQHAMVVGFRSM